MEITEPKKKRNKDEILTTYLSDPIIQQNPTMQEQIKQIVNASVTDLKLLAKDYRLEGISGTSRDELEQLLVTCVKENRTKFPPRWVGKCKCAGKSKVKVTRNQPDPEYCPKCQTMIYYKR